jgi:hypothetical protein
MSNRFEDFIRNNRDELDSEIPATAVWDKVSKRITTPTTAKVKRMHPIRWVAAAAILLFLGTGSYYLVINKDKKANTVAATDPPSQDSLVLNEINPTYAKEVYHFTQLIELKQAELKQLEKDNPELYKQFMGDMTKLDSSYHSLKQELPSNPNREQLLEAMIQNLKLQMDLLNQQLAIIQQINQSKNKKNESNYKST